MYQTEEQSCSSRSRAWARACLLPPLSAQPPQLPLPTPPSCTSAFPPLHPTPAFNTSPSCPRPPPHTHPQWPLQKPWFSVYCGPKNISLGTCFQWLLDPLGWFVFDKSTLGEKYIPEDTNLAALSLTNPSNQLTTCCFESQGHWGNFQTKHLLQGPLQISKH